MTELEIASYLDRRMSRQDRDRVEDHFADCAECRNNLSEAQKVIASVNRPRRVATITGLGILAAGIMLAVAPQLADRRTLVHTARDSGAVTSIAAFAPIGAVDTNSLHFVWARVPNAISYRVTVTTVDGTTMWSATSPDTVAQLPNTVSLTPSTDYVWFADALLPDGTSRSTDLQQFQTPAAGR